MMVMHRQEIFHQIAVIPPQRMLPRTASFHFTRVLDSEVCKLGNGDSSTVLKLNRIEKK